MNNDEQAIRALFSTWQRASLDGDWETLSTLMAEDVIFLTAEFPPIRGRDAFMTLSKMSPLPFRLDFKGAVKELVLMGDWAYAWNHLVVTVTPAEGVTPVRRSGNVLSILHKEADGKWVLKRDANMLKVET